MMIKFMISNIGTYRSLAHGITVGTESQSQSRIKIVNQCRADKNLG